jgi:hypothetical protein
MPTAIARVLLSKGTDIFAWRNAGSVGLFRTVLCAAPIACLRASIADSLGSKVSSIVHDLGRV